MKKLGVLIGVIVALGAGWTGASWYTGKLIEQRMDEAINNANAQIKKNLPEAGITFSYQDYQRGIFSSKSHYILQPDASVTGKKVLQTGEQIILIASIDHGPFPFSQLKKLNFIPSMASVHSELENTPVLKKLFESTQNQSPFSANSRISYRGNISSFIRFIPIEYQQNTTQLKFSGATFDVDISKDMRDIKLSGESNHFVVSNKNSWNQLEQYTLQGVEFKSNHYPGKLDLSIGNQQLAIKQIELDIDGKNSVTLEGFNVATQLNESDNDLGARQTYTLDALKIQGNNFGSGQLVFSVDRLDAQAIKQFEEAYNKHAMQALQKSENIDAQTYQNQLSHLLITQLPNLLKGNPVLTIAPLSWKNSQGESILNLNVEMKDPNSIETSTESQLPLLARSVKKMDVSLTIPLAMATELTMQTARLQGYSPEESQKMAEQQVQGLAAMGHMFKLTTTKDDAISSSFHYADNKVELNGQNMSLHTFLGLFDLLSPRKDDNLNKPADPTQFDSQLPSVQ